MKGRTRGLHTAAERSGIFGHLLRGGASRDGYALLLRNLMPVYEEMERGLDQHRDSAGVRHIASPEIHRAAALRSDLESLCQRPQSKALPLLAATKRYVRRIAAAAGGDGSRLIAHAYVRYLGDINGGQILKRRLCRTLGLGAGALAFYDFPKLADLESFKLAYRRAFDIAASEISDVDAVIEESADVFQLNIDLSQAVLAAAE